MHTEDTTDEAHGLDAFLPWHRAYLLDLERELQAIDPSVALPYWRFDRPAPRLFSRAFMGAAEPQRASCVSQPANPLRLWRHRRAARASPAAALRRPRPAARQLERTGRRREQRVIVQRRAAYAAPSAVGGQSARRAHTSFSGYISRSAPPPATRCSSCSTANVDRLWAKWQWLNRRFDGQADELFFRAPATPGADPDRPQRPRHDVAVERRDRRPRGRDTAPRHAVPDLAGGRRAGGHADRRAMVDYQGVIEPANQLGFDYDDVPFEAEAASDAACIPRTTGASTPRSSQRDAPTRPPQRRAQPTSRGTWSKISSPGGTRQGRIAAICEAGARPVSKPSVMKALILIVDDADEERRATAGRAARSAEHAFRASSSGPTRPTITAALRAAATDDDAELRDEAHGHPGARQGPLRAESCWSTGCAIRRGARGAGAGGADARLRRARRALSAAARDRRDVARAAAAPHGAAAARRRQRRRQT